MGSQMTGTELSSPFQRMPTELVTEIISHSLTDGKDKQFIASVSKAWRSIILGTPRFWRHVKVVSWKMSNDSLKKLKRALELSGSVTLDVDIALDGITFRDSSQHLLLEHLRTLADSGIHRWRSLTLTDFVTPQGKPNPLLGIFTGKMSSLRSLRINDGEIPHGQQEIFEPIYSLIAETKPNLHSFSYVPGEAPEILTRMPIYRNLTSIVSRAKSIAQIRPKFDVPDLYVTNYYPLDVFEAFDLPPTTRFNAIKLGQLSECGLDSVQLLEIRQLNCSNNSDSNPSILRLPNLHTLEVRIDLYVDCLSWLLDTEAPKLSDLAITSSSLGDPRSTTEKIYRIFKSEKDRIKIRPTCLKLGILLNVTSTLQILKQWPQIQDLTLYWNQKFKWGGRLLSGLCNKNRNSNALCPDLQVLRVVMWPDNWSKEATTAWLQAARRILKARKNVLPLWRITLSERWGPPVLPSITIFDVD